MSKKRCCKWHDKLPEEIIPDAQPDPYHDGAECGLAGMGKPYVCCADCPQAEWFIKGRGMKPSDINFVKEMVEQS